MIAKEIQHQVFKDGDKYVRPTGESPRQFEGILFAVYEGKSPETVEEALRSLVELERMETVDPSGLSDSWQQALKLDLSSDSDTHHQGMTDGNRPNTRRPKQSNVEVVETHFVKVSPTIGWLYFNFFIVTFLIATYAIGTTNHWFTALCLMLAYLSLIYGCSSAYLAGGTRLQRR